ncbi:MAG: Mrp/NBP35 family ATP-binding protein [Deltaproteobacteria bacterium]|nr:Mrp/NBP35 family ATP-binding protein [Deltaproteobacteria bacterium]
MASLDDVRTALSRVIHPGFSHDIVSLGVVRDVSLRDGHVTVTLDAPSRKRAVVEALHDAIATELRRIVGVAEVTIIPATSAEAIREQPQGPRALEPLPGVAHIVAVASGKGGVGKSTVAVNLALALSGRGLRVGLLDADVHGPSAPLMTGTTDARPQMVEGKKIVPIRRNGIAIVSMGFFVDDRSPVIWRGPMVMSIVRQFLKDVLWGDLDVLVVDLPPGTGDAQLTLLQEVPIAGGVIVTTPQDVALQDVRRGISMFATVQTPVLGIVENMSGYVCPHCNEHDPIFATEGGVREAESLGVPLLGRLALVTELRAAMDRGTPLVVAQPDHPVAMTFRELAGRIATALRLVHDEPL